MISEPDAVLTGLTCDAPIANGVAIGAQLRNASDLPIRAYEASAFVERGRSEQVATPWDHGVLAGAPGTTNVVCGQTFWVSFELSTDEPCVDRRPVQLSVAYVITGRGGGTFDLTTTIDCSH